MIAIVDYGMGNVRSVYNALAYLGEEATITADPSVIDGAARLILPGVGAFGDAMRNIESRGLDQVLSTQVLQKGKPLLGICLGLQLMARNSSEHGCHDGLGWFDAEVVRFQDDGNLPIPHIGWNTVTPQFDHPMLANLKEGQFSFYFVHSYHIVCSDVSNSAAVCDYSYPFTAAIQKNNVFATQFHPEKSQDNGLQILKNFIAWNP